MGTITRLAIVEPGPGTLRFDDAPGVPLPVGNNCTNPASTDSVIVALSTTAVASAGTPFNPATCKAVLDPGSSGDGATYVIDGQKMWLTNGGSANLVAVLVKTDEGADSVYRNMTTFLVEKEEGFGETAQGITVPGKIEKMGYKGVDTTELVFEGHRISADQIRPAKPLKTRTSPMVMITTVSTDAFATGWMTTRWIPKPSTNAIASVAANAGQYDQSWFSISAQQT